MSKAPKSASKSVVTGQDPSPGARVSRGAKVKLVSSTLAKADCVAALPKLGPGTVHLAICDSPYNYGAAYDKYNDHRPHNEFMAWMKQWLFAVADALHPHGSLWIFAPDEWVSEVDMLCRRDVGLHWRGWVCWYFTFGVANQRNFSRSHTHILYFTKAKTKFTFNDEAVRVPSARQLVYKDKRQNPKGKLPDNTWVLLREQLEEVMLPDHDTWLESRVCGTYKERKKHSPNQIPVALLERIVLSTSNPGDLVCDPFLGTGSTGVAAVMHGRNFIGYDISAECVKASQKRIDAAIRGHII